MGIIRVCDVCEKNFPQKGESTMTCDHLTIGYECDECFLKRLSSLVKDKSGEEEGIKRRFLVNIEILPISFAYNFFLITKCYLNLGGDIERRIRVISDNDNCNIYSGTCFYTEKIGKLGFSSEKEVEVSLNDFVCFLKLAECVITKRIKVFVYDYWVDEEKISANIEASMFVFGNANDANREERYLAEVKFESEEQAGNFVPPKWFTQEVTVDSRFSSQQLAKHGWPEEAV